MYNPKAFQIEDTEVAAAFMRHHSFATIVTAAGDLPQASHVPFVIDTSRTGLPALYAHLARANPQWRAFDGVREALIIFQGPHGYVSPSLYKVHPAVPTWNYQAVHAYGIPTVVATNDETRRHVLQLIRQHEAAQPQPWQPNLPEDYLEARLREIVAFRIDVTRIEAKFKLSQNRSAADRENVTSTFETSDDPAQRILGRAMRASPHLPD